MRGRRPLDLPAEEVEQLRELAKQYSDAEIARVTGMSKTQVVHRRKRYGILSRRHWLLTQRMCAEPKEVRSYLPATLEASYALRAKLLEAKARIEQRCSILETHICTLQSESYDV